MRRSYTPLLHRVGYLNGARVGYRPRYQQGDIDGSAVIYIRTNICYLGY